MRYDFAGGDLALSDEMYYWSWTLSIQKPIGGPVSLPAACGSAPISRPMTVCHRDLCYDDNGLTSESINKPPIKCCLL